MSKREQPQLAPGDIAFRIPPELARLAIAAAELIKLKERTLNELESGES